MEVSTSPSPQAEADVVAGIACILLLEISLLKHFDSLVVPCVSSFHVDDRANFGCVRVSCNSQAVWQRYRCCEQLNQASRGMGVFFRRHAMHRHQHQHHYQHHHHEDHRQHQHRHRRRRHHHHHHHHNYHNRTSAATTTTTSTSATTAPTTNSSDGDVFDPAYADCQDGADILLLRLTPVLLWVCTWIFV